MANARPYFTDRFKHRLIICVKTAEKSMKKILVVLAITLIFGSIAPAETGSCTAGSMTVNFSSASFVIGLGWNSGTTRTISWEGSCSGCNYGPAIYGWGWASSSLVEYYIGRGGGTSCGSYSTIKGTFTLYTKSCNGPNITGNGLFTQYNASGNGSSSQNMGEHFNGWSSLGRGLTNQNYQVVAIESWSGGSGSAIVGVLGSNWYTRWVASGSATFTCGSSSQVNATANVNLNTTYQQIEGFGGAICYDVWHMATYPTRDAVYNLLFRDLGLDILRIKNTYEISASDVNYTAQIVEAAKLRNPELKTLLVPWSPKESLKSDGTLGGVNSTLKQDANDPNNSAPYFYVYNDYAKWWLNSLTGAGGYFSQGVFPDYISIQNEPDWGYQDQVCRFTPTENSTYAGYDKAFEAVYNKLDGNVSPMPKMIAPETGDLINPPSFIDALVNRGQINNIYGFSHHLYNVDFNYPDDAGQISRMQNFKTNYGDYYNKPSFMTEYGGSGTPDFTMAMYLAQHIYNCLVYEGVTSYVHWSLIRGDYTTGGVINLPAGGSYIVRDLYWFLKHYAFFVKPGWYRAGATTASGDLRITSFRNIYDTNTAIVILNKSLINDVNLTLSLDGFVSQSTWTVNEIYRSSSTEQWASLGQFYPSQPLLIPPQSITTIHLATYQTCDEVIAHGHWFNSDLNEDCYVNFYDLEIIVDNWLRQDCGYLNDWCDWADWFTLDGSVDFGDLTGFAPEWMQCNNPQDVNCTLDW